MTNNTDGVILSFPPPDDTPRPDIRELAEPEENHLYLINFIKRYEARDNRPPTRRDINKGISTKFKKDTETLVKIFSECIKNEWIKELEATSKKSGVRYTIGKPAPIPSYLLSPAPTRKPAPSVVTVKEVTYIKRAKNYHCKKCGVPVLKEFMNAHSRFHKELP